MFLYTSVRLKVAGQASLHMRPPSSLVHSLSSAVLTVVVVVIATSLYVLPNVSFYFVCVFDVFVIWGLSEE